MDRYPGTRQVLSITSTPLEMVVDSADAVELARTANDEMAELVAGYPDYFAAGVALLPMNDVDVRIQAGGKPVDHHVDGVRPDPARIGVVARQRMPIGNEIKAIVIALILERDPV